jgi:hypothetical protein
MILSLSDLTVDSTAVNSVRHVPFAAARGEAEDM